MGWQLKKIFHSIRLIAVSAILLVFIPLIFCACGSNTGRMVSQSLTAEEMAIPPGRYQNGIDMRQTGQVDLDSPQNEPVFRWVVKTDVAGGFTDVLVDGQGGIWYNDGPPDSMANNIIIRLNPDGSEDLRKGLLSNGSFSNSNFGSGGLSLTGLLNRVKPVIVLNNGVILWVSTMSTTSLEVHCFLECMDIDGQVRWSTAQAELPQNTEGIVWRAPGDRVMMLVSDATIKFYSLENGEYLDSFDVAGFPISLESGGPISLDDSDWVFYGYRREESEESSPFISRIHQDGTSAWYKEYPEFEYSYPIAISENEVICCGNTEGIAGIDSNDGSILWKIFSASNHALGLNRDGNFIVSGFDSPDSDGHLRLIDENGFVLWSDNVFIRDPDAMIVYRDNSILVAYNYGISLVEPDGSVRWTVDLADLHYTGDDDFSHWRLNPTPEGNIVAIGDNMYGGYHSEIFYLEQQ